MAVVGWEMDEGGNWVRGGKGVLVGVDLLCLTCLRRG